MMRRILGLGIQLATVAMLASLTCLPAAAIESAPKAEPVAQAQAVPAADPDESADACLSYTPAQATDDQSALVASLIQPVSATDAKTKPCKACPAQPWCACKYNGYPRVSCDPCCYINPYNGQQICTS